MYRQLSFCENVSLLQCTLRELYTFRGRNKKTPPKRSCVAQKDRIARQALPQYDAPIDALISSDAPSILATPGQIGAFIHPRIKIREFASRNWLFAQFVYKKPG